MQIANLKIKKDMILAPMAGVSDYPFRTVCRDYGCKLAFSEMVSAEGLVRGYERTSKFLYKGKEEKENYNLTGFQIFGSNPDSMAEAANILQDMGADIVDINMGCPVKKITKIVAGSALLADLNLMTKIVEKVRKRLSVPFTVKVRTGFANDVNVIEVSNILEQSGVDAISIHGRTQKQAYKGFADWEIISKVKDLRSIPVIGNGDVISSELFDKRKTQSGCDAIMVGRGAMGRPWIFRSFDYKPSKKELLDIMLKHYRLSIEFYGKEKGVFEMRKHISWYTKGIENGNSLRSLVNTIKEPEKVIDGINNFFDRNESINII